MWFALALAFFWHGVHMSTTTVDYQSSSKSVEILIAMSADHLEEILRTRRFGETARGHFESPHVACGLAAVGGAVSADVE